MNQEGVENMKPNRLSLFILSLCLSALVMGCRTTGLREYEKSLGDIYGMTSYKNPNNSYGPGTILRLAGMEALVFRSQRVTTAFPGIEMSPPTLTAEKLFEAVKSVDIQGSAESDLTRIIPLEIHAALTNRSHISLSWQPRVARIYVVEEGVLSKAFREFDYGNRNQRDIVETLMEPRTVIVTGALMIDDATYSFWSSRGYDIHAAFDLAKFKSSFGGTVEGVTSNSMVIRSTNALYYAYYVCPLKLHQLREMYQNGKHVYENEERLRLAKASPKPEEIEAKMQLLRKDLSEKNRSLGELLPPRSSGTGEGVETAQKANVDTKIQTLQTETAAIDRSLNEMNTELSKAMAREQEIKSLTEETRKLKEKTFDVLGQRMSPAEVKAWTLGNR